VIAAQLARVRARLESRPAGLVSHVGRVLTEATALAGCWDLDEQRVELAVWGHDLFRAADGAELLRRSLAAKLPVTSSDEQSPVLLHGPLAAYVLTEDFGVQDDEVLEAVRAHTLGLGRMSTLAKVILLADKVETMKRRGERELQAIRRLAQRDLDLALLCWADCKLLIERGDGWPSDPRHWKARVTWLEAGRKGLGSVPMSTGE